MKGMFWSVNPLWRHPLICGSAVLVFRRREGSDYLLLTAHRLYKRKTKPSSNNQQPEQQRLETTHTHGSHTHAGLVFPTSTNETSLEERLRARRL